LNEKKQAQREMNFWEFLKLEARAIRLMQGKAKAGNRSVHETEEMEGIPSISERPLH
jgi:hypothetical protein